MKTRSHLTRIALATALVAALAACSDTTQQQAQEAADKAAAATRQAAADTQAAAQKAAEATTQAAQTAGDAMSATADQAAVAELTWNLNTERNLPVASGVYVYQIEVDGVGTKVDRIAVFIEEERLDNF